MAGPVARQPQSPSSPSGGGKRPATSTEEKKASKRLCVAKSQPGDGELPPSSGAGSDLKQAKQYLMEIQTLFWNFQNEINKLVYKINSPSNKDRDNDIKSLIDCLVVQKIPVENCAYVLTSLVSIVNQTDAAVNIIIKNDRVLS